MHDPPIPLSRINAARNLTPEEVKILEEENIFIGSAVNGARKMTTAALSCFFRYGDPTPVANRTMTDGLVSIQVHAALAASAPTCPIPELMESVATLEYLGYTKEGAEKVFARYMNRSNPDNITNGILHFAIDEVNEDTALEELAMLETQPPTPVQAIEAMTALGITEELQATLTDPKHGSFSDPRYVKYWLEDTMKLRFITLGKIQERLRKYAVDALAMKEAVKSRLSSESNSNDLEGQGEKRVNNKRRRNVDDENGLSSDDEDSDDKEDARDGESSNENYVVD